MYYNAQSLVFLNGKFVPAQSPAFDPYSQSLHYGNGVFEGIRAYPTPGGTRIFKARAHFERLQFSCKSMHIPFDYTVEDLEKWTYELLERNNLQDAYIRPLVVTGAGMSLYASNESHLLIQAWEWGKYMGTQLLKVMTSSYQRPNPKSCVVEAKITGHYVNSILATTEASDKGFDQPLMLDLHERVAEGSGANFFMEKDGVLYTPPVGHIMPGITRATILELCQEADIPVVEKHFYLDEVKQADSAFFVGTAAEVAGIGQLDEYTFPMDWNQSLGHRLAERYTALVREASPLLHAS